MTTAPATEEFPVLTELPSPAEAGHGQLYFSRMLKDPGAGWNFTTVTALLMLVVLWAAKVYMTWAAWGNLSIDSGHEMYVPVLLAEGKQLYRDVWFMYTPAGPYFNSYLFRLFGVHLNVLYWAGSLAALGSAIFLYLSGMRLSSWVLGWAAGAVVLLEAFQPSLFCFPLPYSFSTVYACLVGCLFLWLVLEACYSLKWAWIFGAGTAAAVALLLKPEFGTACYGTLALLILLRSYLQRSWRLLASDIAVILPGVLFCALVIRWMVSIAGVEFITQENIMSWPTSYFMKQYGQMWLARTGFTITGSAFHEALFRTVPLAVAVSVSICVLWWKQSDARPKLLKAVFVLAAIVYFVRDIFLNFLPPDRLEPTISTVFFPKDMVLYVMLAAVVAWGLFWRQSREAIVRSPAFAVALTFSSLLAFRILMNMTPEGYPIYYNGPVVLCFLLLLRLILSHSGRSSRVIFMGEVALCLACLAPVALHAMGTEAVAKNYVPLTTDRGTVRISRHLAQNYSAAIQFMKAKAALGQSVLSVPEDTSLYFFSGTYCPTRVYLFTPGALAPGKMTDDMIREINRKPVDYLLWSNRIFPEYGVPVFGKDFYPEVGNVLRSNYHTIGPLIPRTGNYREWSAVVWERNREGQPR